MCLLNRAGLILFFAITSLFAHAQEGLRLMAWNVYMLPPPVVFSKQKERTKLQINALKHLALENDVLVLTEAFQARYKKKILKELETEYPYYYIQKRKGGLFKIMPSGVMILSKYPMDVLGEVYFDKCTAADCFASKAALLVEIKKGDGTRLQVLGTHMQSGSGEKIKKIRKIQIEDIKKLLDEYREEDIPQLVAGDLNINSAEGVEFDEMLLTLGLEPLGDHMIHTNSKAERSDCFGVKYDGKEKNIDHILVRANGSSIRLAEEKVYPLRDFFNSKMECDLSDHHPVQSLVIFNSRGPTSLKKTTFQIPLMVPDFHGFIP